MGQTRSLLVAGDTAPDQTSEADRIKIYIPRLNSQFRSGFVLVCISLFGLFPLKGILDWFSGGAVPSTKTLLALVFLLILPVLAIAILVLNASRRLPRLTITR